MFREKDRVYRLKLRLIQETEHRNENCAHSIISRENRSQRESEKARSDRIRKIANYITRIKKGQNNVSIENECMRSMTA